MQIKETFVSLHVYACASQMISELQETELSEDINQLFYYTEDYEQMVDDFFYNKAEEEIKEILDEYDVENITDLDYPEFVRDKDMNIIYREPYEFWIVSDYLFNNLKENGYIVAEFLGFNIWGRETTGQAISLDYAISQITEQMQILEGQQNEWK